MTVKELIALSEVTIEKNRIKITSESTAFASYTLREYPEIDDILKELSILKKRLKDNDTSIGRRGLKKILEENKVQYNHEIKEYEEMFNSLYEKWKNKIDNEGLRYGFLDDNDYIEIRELSFRFEEFYYADHVLSIVSGIKYEIDRINNEIDRGKKFSKVYL